MKITVIDPVVTLLTCRSHARTQLTTCAYAAGVSRGREDAYVIDGVVTGGTHAKSDVIAGEWKSFKQAEELLEKLLSKRPAHESVLEHSSIAFHVTCSRIATHELVRHRLCAFTQSSTRYIEEKEHVILVRPPGMSREDLGEYTFQSGIPTGEYPMWIVQAGEAIHTYQVLRGSIRRESARYLLPHCLAAQIVVTTNFRQWRHMIRMRTHRTAAPEMRQIFGSIRDMLYQISPVLVEPEQ